MQRYNGQLINQFPNTINGNAAAGAQVTIRLKSSGTIATLYATNSISGGTLPNPLTADAKGYYGFYAADGVYTLDVNIAGTPQLEIQLQDVAALQSQFNDAVSNAGYIPVGTFSAGCTVSQANGVVSDGSSYWRWDGALPKVVTAGSEPLPVGVGGWILVSDQGFRGELAADNSTVLVGGIEANDLARKYSEIISVKDFGAIGDGIANDKAAIESAAAAVPAAGGILHIPAGTYYSPTGFLIQRNNITIIGDGMPRVSDDLTQLVGGTILQGTVLIDGHNVTVENLGADHGIAYSNAHKAGAGGDGLVIHPVVLDLANVRKNINVKNVIGLTRIGDYTDAQAAFHAVLIEGLRGGSADNVVGVGGWFGVVFKVADFNIGKVEGRENDSVSVYLKSNTYAPVDRVNINSVITSNFTSRGFIGFLVQASDAELQAVTVGNVSVMGGVNAARVEAEVTQPVVSVSIGQIAARNVVDGFSVRGAVYGCVVDGVTVWQPSGVGFYTSANTGGTHPIDVTASTIRVVASTSTVKAVDIGSNSTKAVIGTINAAGAGGSNLLAGSIINIQPSTEIGQYFGTLTSGGASATLVNGWASSFAQSTGLVVKSGITSGYGRISAASATSDVFMTIPAGMRPNNLEFFTTMTGLDGATSKNVPINVKVAANGEASVFPNRASYSVAWYNLTDLRFATSIPAEGAI